MMKSVSKILRRKEAGFLLTEVLIALIIASTIAIGASAMVVQLINVKSTNANNVTVTSNINSATDSLVPDVQMAQIDVTEDEDGNNVITGGIGQAAEGETEWVRATDPETGDEIITGMGALEGETEWLWLEWTWTDGKHRVTYRIEDGGSLYRIHTIDGLPEGRTLVAKYIDAGQSTWRLVIGEPDEETGESAKLTLEITISASTGGYKSASEGRTIQVVPRITS